MRPLVSIVIPAYNRKKVISRAIDSCLAQTYQGIEIIICDDHSTDGTMEFVREKYAMDDNIVYCTTPIGKKGANAARNEGAKQAKGSFVAFLDSDDYLLEDSVEIRLKAIMGTEYGLVYGNVYTRTNGKHGCRMVQFEDISRFKQKNYLVSELSLCITSSMMIRKDVLEDIGYLDEHLKCWQDDDLAVSVGMKYRMCHCLKPVAVIVTTPKSISKSEENIYQGCREIVKKHKAEIMHFSSYGRYFIWQIRIFSLWTKYREQNTSCWIMKLLYMFLHMISNRIITPLFRHMYA